MGNYPPNNVLNVSNRVSVQSDVLLVGQTLADDKSGIYITPIAKNSTTPTSMDLVVNLGDFSSQPVPTIQPLAAVPAPDAKGNYMANAAVTFTATANDSAGNPLAYFWDFNDGTYSTDNKSAETHSWSKLGTYRVRCIVSDMMGHRASAGTTITVTDASDVVKDFVVTGNCTVLADSAAGVDGAQVSGLGETVYSDTNGAYLIHNVSGGTLAAVKEGYRGDMPPPATTATSNDPYWNSFQGVAAIPAGVSKTNQDLTSVHRATVTLSPTVAAVNEGTTLTVTVTRALDVGSNSTVAEQNAYNWWLSKQTPVTVWIPEIVGDGVNGDAYGVHSVQDALAMITIPTSGAGITITNSSLSVTPGATAHLQWTFNIPAGATSATAKITFKSLAAKNPPRVLQFILQNSIGADPGLTANYNTGYTAANPTSGQMIVTVTDPTSPPTATLVANQPTAIEGGASGQFTITTAKAPASDQPINFQVVVQSPSGGESGATTNTWGNPSSAATPVTDYNLTDVSGNPITLTAVNDSFGNIISYTGSATIKAGTTSTVINVNPVDNGLLDPNKVVDLALNADKSSPAKYILGLPHEAVVDIADKNPLPVLSIIATIPTCTEGQDGKFTVTRNASDISKPMSVPYAISGSALNGVEYKRLYGSVIIPANAPSADIVIHSLADTLLDNGIDALNLAPAQIADICTLTLKSDTAWSIDFIHYRDNVIILSSGGKPYVSVQTGNAAGTGGGTADEANKGNPGWFKFSRLNTVGDLVINYTVSGTAVKGVDYDVDVPAKPPKNQAITFNGTITIPDTFTTAYVNLDVFFDNLSTIEDTRTIVVSITPSGSYDIDPSGALATMAILDGTQIVSGPYAGTEVNTINLTSTNRNAMEKPVVYGNFYVERSGSGGAKSQPLTVNFSLKSGPGYAVQGTDFKLVEHNSGVTLTNSVTIPAGVQFASIDLIPIDNLVSEGTLKVMMTIVDMTDALNNPYSVGIPNTDTVTIGDGDPNGNPTLPTVAFDKASDGSINRPIPGYQIGVSLSAPVPVGQVATVDYHISGGTALILTDYDLVPNKEIFGGTLTFSAGQQKQTINLDILNTKRLADLTIMVSLSNAYNSVLGAPSTFTYTIFDPTPVINSDLAPIDIIGTPFNYQITATNGPLTGYTAVGLPSWATLNTSTGVISGIPTAPAATTQVTITVSNAYATGSATLVITIDNPVPPVITSALTATAFVGFPYNPFYQITATNFPNAYNAVGLPAGLTVNTSTGAISGTPTASPGTYTVTISASNLGGSGSATLKITLSNPPPPVINSATTDNATAGWPYNYQITATNFPSSFNASGLPTGLSINTSTGLISGAPGAAGTFTINLSATNAGGTGTAKLTLTVALPAPPVINSASTITWVYNVPFSYQITATNIPLSFSATGLPAWATLNTSTGAITGTPDALGTSTVTINAANLGGTGAATLSITITDVLPPVITSALTATGTNGVAFSYQITATNNPTSYSATNLPQGLSIDTATGIISGTPLVPVDTSVTIGAINHGGTGTATLVISISIDPNSGPILTSGVTASPNPADVNQSITFTAFVADPRPNTLYIAWDFGDGSVSYGVAVSHSYVVAGTYNVTVKVLDGLGKTTSGSVSVVVGDGGGGGGGGGLAGLALTISKMQGSTKFTTSGKDGVALTGVLKNVPTPFNPTGQSLVLNVGGATATIKLDKHGKAKTSTATFAFKLKALKRSKTNPNPGFNGGNVTFSAKFANGSWAAVWNITSTTSGSMNMPAALTFGGNTYTTNVTLSYSGNAKGGKFKKQ
jgi:PKD repeat protein